MVKVSYGVLSREFFMLINNVIMVVSLAVVLWGTLAPIGYEALSGGRISIGTPFFNAFFVPLGLLLLGALAFLPVLNWKRTRPKHCAASMRRLQLLVCWECWSGSYSIRPRWLSSQR